MSDPIPALADLVASLHVPRSAGALHPATERAYDAVRNAIDDFGWSTAEEIEARIRKALTEDETGGSL